MKEAAQSALAPGGAEAATLLALFWPVVALLGAIWLAVLLVAALGLWRRPGQPRRPGWPVGVATAGTVLVIIGLTFASYLATRPLSAAAEAPLVVQIQGRQWWWQVAYPAEGDAPGFTTANELRLPLGRQVRLELAAGDVIHSFWVPNLAGKQDLIPGRDNALLLTPREAGIYRAQCAEFCGLQHARMALLVMVQPAEEFARWRAAQAAPAAEPALAAEGRRVFEARQCSACHTVRGSTAKGSTGPDLTHLASRGSIGAGLLPMTRGALAAWVADPQTLKPGNNMPLVPLSSDELQALTDFMALLQ
ncbi:cytochrome c oxidase subunit II [Siccirubricoccus sp. KC 17139]|uniref:Cytochrome aa3 subunit 2 n=1 Tax=Siccirubricoccus soli TaxID=2899147 RepID=A0ABT1CZG0_9PROT|nr:cytochrome c oxidase subunit II [Siccirubricoccus soli]MCO6415061.1 cytochrome c oxidase subunit II [Siccirubricoccus soli]MCP2681192.1 cytochrome c oxidase subunit II [Siccirubricoccus soli]